MSQRMAKTFFCMLICPYHLRVILLPEIWYIAILFVLLAVENLLLVFEVVLSHF